MLLGLGHVYLGHRIGPCTFFFAASMAYSLYFLTWRMDFAPSQCCFNTSDIILGIRRGKTPRAKLTWRMDFAPSQCCFNTSDIILSIRTGHSLRSKLSWRMDLAPSQCCFHTSDSILSIRRGKRSCAQSILSLNIVMYYLQ